MEDRLVGIFRGLAVVTAILGVILCLVGFFNGGLLVGIAGAFSGFVGFVQYHAYAVVLDTLQRTQQRTEMIGVEQERQTNAARVRDEQVLAELVAIRKAIESLKPQTPERIERIDGPDGF